MEYKAKVKAKLKGNPVEIEITFDYDVQQAIMSRALKEVEHIGLTEASILNLRQVAQQLELDFGEDSSEEEDISEENEYTSYSSGMNSNCCEDPKGFEAPQSSTGYSSYAQQPQSQASGYTSYAAEPSPFNVYRRPVTYTPKINGKYVPYHTEPVGISEDYLDFDFD